MNDLIDNYLKENEYYSISYESSEFVNEELASPQIKNAIDYIKKKLDFSYGNELCVEQPFAPQIILADGRRSVSIEDLEESDIIKIGELLSYTNDNFLLGKWNDILGILTKDKSYVEKAAINLYIHFKKIFKIHPRYHVAEILKRPLYLWNSLNKNSSISDCIEEILNSEIFHAKESKVIILRVLSAFVCKYSKKNIDRIVNAIIECFDSVEVSDVLLELADTVIKYFSSKHDDVNCFAWRIKYKDVCCKLAEQRGNHGYEYYIKAIEHLDSEVHEDIINDLRFKIDEMQESLYDSLNMQYLPMKLPKKMEKEFFEHRKTIIDSLNKAADGVMQLLLLLAHIKPSDIKSMENEIEKNKHSLLRLVNNVSFNDEKHIAFESSRASEEDRREYDIANSLRMHMGIQYELFLAPFIYYFKNDDTVRDLLEDLLAHNYFVPAERKEIIRDAILKGFDKDIRGSLFVLLSQFEFGCKHYLKVHKRIHTDTRVGSMKVPVDLNKILVQKKGRSNKFRDAIRELLGDNMTLSLEYLACRPLSGNIRNRNYHDGIKKKDSYDLEEVFLFYYLFEAYCLGYDPEI